MTTASSVLTLALSLGTIALGGWLLFSARRRGEGTAPHCLLCGYNLTGLTAPRCPECGVELTVENRSIGPPSEFQPLRMLAGVVIVGGVLGWTLWRYYCGP